VQGRSVGTPSVDLSPIYAFFGYSSFLRIFLSRAGRNQKQIIEGWSGLPVGARFVKHISKGKMLWYQVCIG